MHKKTHIILVNNVEFDGAFFRKDIGFKGIK
jgi:hypothetical protein